MLEILLFFMLVVVLLYIIKNEEISSWSSFKEVRIKAVFLFIIELPDRHIHFTGWIFYYLLLNVCILLVFLLPVILRFTSAPFIVSKFCSLSYELVCQHSVFGIFVRSGIFCFVLSCILASPEFQVSDISECIDLPILLGLDLDIYSMSCLLKFSSSTYWALCPGSLGVIELFSLLASKQKK